ncbi:MAG: SEC-C domain-containing protein [Candidatus Eisenbacteria bacterium]|nr:SEC-C domain-containing protein [Candidatus Eisenbacteria bacterium]
MTRAGRNAPCPCGSGKKYKHCCLASDVTPQLLLDPRVRQCIETDQRMTSELVRFAAQRFGEDWLGDALEEFLPGAGQGDPEMESPIFVPWALFHDRPEGSTVAELYFEKPPRPIGPAEREWSDAERKAWLSVWEMTRVERDRGIHATDLLTGERRFVSEISATRTLVDRDCVLCRIVDYPGFSVFSGVYPRPLPPREADEVVQHVRMLLGRSVKPVPLESLWKAEMMPVLADLWRDALEEIDSGSRLPKQLANTDGDPLLLTTDTYSFDPTAREPVIARISALEGADLGRTEEGCTSIQFLKQGNPMHASWDNTVIGVARVAADRLTLETNSLKRADDLRARVTGVCPELGASPLRKHQDPMAMLKDRSLGPQEAGSEKRARETPPELQEVLREFKRREYQDWLDSEIPALGGLTPRAAAKRVRSRSKLDLLLREIEHGEARLPEAERFSVAELRRELGLEA